MSEICCTLLADRGLLSVAGDDRRTFLQGLLTNDVTAATADHVIWAALLTPQGKYLHDVFLFEMGETLYLEAEQARLADLKTRLSRYKLRAKVRLAEVEGWSVAVAFGPGVAARLGLPETVAGAAAPLPDGAGVAFTDPRLPQAPVRLILPTDQAGERLVELFDVAADPTGCDAERIRLGLPDGSRDLEVEKALILESGFDELGGVAFKKGCYIGQELTARMKYRALAKKRLLPITLADGATPVPGTPLLTADGKEAGEVRSAAAGVALALVRLEHLSAPLTAGGTAATPVVPPWVRLPQPKEAAGA